MHMCTHKLKSHSASHLAKHPAGTGGKKTMQMHGALAAPAKQTQSPIDDWLQTK